MLERSISSVEPSLQLLLRHIEQPATRQRKVGRAIWSHGRQTHVHPWWPLFLEVASSSNTPSTVSTVQYSRDQRQPFLDFLYPPAGRSTVSRRPYPIPKLNRRHRTPRYNKTQTRAYTTSPRFSQNPDSEGQDSRKFAPYTDKTFWPDGLDEEPRPKHYWGAGMEGEYEHKGSDKTYDGTHQGVETPHGNSRSREIDAEVNSTSEVSKQIQKYEDISPAEALDQFFNTPVEERTAETRISAVEDALDLKESAKAIAIIKQAKLTHADDLAELASYGLRRLLIDGHFLEAAQLSHSMRQVLTDHFQPGDIHTVLPYRMMSVLQMLKEMPGGYSPERDQLQHIAQFMLHQAFGNERFLGSLSPEGLITIVDGYHDQGLLSARKMVVALATLKRLSTGRPRHDMALIIYRAMRHRFPTIVPHRKVYAFLLVILAKASLTDTSPFEFVLDEFAKAYGTPDPWLYQVVLTAYSQMGDSKAVTELFRRYCVSHGETKQQSIHNPLIYVHARVGNIPMAQETFKWIQKDLGIAPDLICWNTLLYAHARAGDLEGALDVFWKMQEAGMIPDSYTYGTIMAIVAKLGDTDSVLYIAGQAQRENVPLTAPMLDCLIRAYCKSHQPEKAEEVLENMALKDYAKQDSVRLWNSLLVYYANRANSQQLLRIQQRMKELGLTADSMTYAALMQSLCKVGRSSDALKILRALHLSQHMTVTASHYAIVMHGFALEQNRNQVTLLYHELLQQTNRPGFSANLAMLKMQVRRDMLNADKALSDIVLRPHMLPSQLARQKHKRLQRLPHATAFMNNILNSVDFRDLASKSIVPGGRMTKVSDIIPPAFFQVMISALGKRGAYSKISQLLAQFKELQKSFPQQEHLQQKYLPPMLLSECMRLYAFHGQTKNVERLWKQHLKRSITEGLSKVELLQGLASKENSRALQRADSIEDLLRTEGLRIMPSQSQILGAPLNYYIFSLGDAGRHAEVPSLVQRLEEIGFVLKNNHWNVFVQVLASSPDPNLQSLAFTTFQDKLVENMPSWNLLKRGKTLPSDLHKDSTGSIARLSLLESIDPHIRQPYYRTLVFLGAALMKFRERSQTDGGAELHRLLAQASNTVVAVAQMPYLRDRVQGVLLRQSAVKGDLLKVKERGLALSPPQTLLAATSPELSQEVLEDVIELQHCLSQEADTSLSDDQRARLLRVAISLYGEIPTESNDNVHAPHETDSQRAQRMAAVEAERLTKIRELLSSREQSRLIADDTSGDLPIQPLGLPFAEEDADATSLGSPSTQQAPMPPVQSEPSPAAVSAKFASDDAYESGVVSSLETPYIARVPGFIPHRFRHKPKFILPHNAGPLSKFTAVVVGTNNSRRKEKAFSRRKRLARQRRASARVSYNNNDDRD